MKQPLLANLCGFRLKITRSVDRQTIKEAKKFRENRNLNPKLMRLYINIKRNLFKLHKYKYHINKCISVR
uniref:Uncharacterized protein n=1 Tax=Rhizophora mucronata TaxID=61149 RepID=A0A2P2LA33_RHIMU